jgi:Na+-transporting NADH:ubiquinone oxidoreductase subunit NqrB
MDELKQMLRKREIKQSLHVTCILYALLQLEQLKIV